MKLNLVETTYMEQQKIVRREEVQFQNDNEQENELLNLYPQVNYQSFEGFGGAITESAGYIYSLLSDIQKKELLQTYFSPENMKYRMVRIPIDSCDFSLNHYEAMSDPTDLTFQSFQLDRVEQYIFPLLDAAQEVFGGKIPIMLTPWSPPVFMKTNGERNHGGKLKEEYQVFWAEYICRYIQAFLDRGYEVKRISIQNEPKAVQTWDSCVYTSEEEKTFLCNYLYPAMELHKLMGIEIFIWDHNKERAYERACEVIDEESNSIISGVAFHWYSGDHFEALRLIKEQYPDKQLILSEACIEYSKFSQEDYLANAQKYAHDLIGNINNGMSAFYDWNLILDEKGGPNHVGNYCDAPYHFDTVKKALIERNTASYIWHFSHFIEKGAVRIAFSSYTNLLEASAFKNPDGNLVVILLNQTKQTIKYNLRLHKQMVSLSMNPSSIQTVYISLS